ncbi:MAG: glycosyltransferase family 4 protein, partial [Candidatus Limnocylindrales bacterium]
MSSPPASGSPAPVRVCLDAHLVSGAFGGVEQVIIGLADGLSRLTDSPDEYLFLVDWDNQNWLKPYVGGPCRLLIADRSVTGGRGGFLGKQQRRLAWYLGRRGASPAETVASDLPSADPAVERARVDVMHFTMQVGFRTSIPSIYQPWDLQHLHLPQFFTPETIARREFAYRALCDQAATVVVMSSWVKRDIVEKYSLPEDKVRVV